MTGIVSQDSIEALGEDLAGTGWNVAEPTPAVDAHANRLTSPRQVERATLIMAMLTSAGPTALGTRDRQTRRFHNKHQTPDALDDDQHDASAVHRCSKRLSHRRSPSMATLARSAAHRKSLDIGFTRSPGDKTKATPDLGKLDCRRCQHAPACACRTHSDDDRLAASRDPIPSCW
jgi:hypothetical protein